MVHVEIADIADQYTEWRKEALAKQKQNSQNLANPIPEIPTWNEWQDKAQKATIAAIASIKKGSRPKFNENIWQTLKGFLKVLFHGKCAYCEGHYAAGSYLDVEHYRPKAKITFDHVPDNIVKITGSDGQEKNHPGYYWLAYDPQNLLLSCEKCNRGAGKMNQFPIRGPRACYPGDSLDDERPLLLIPYREKKQLDHFTIMNEQSGFLEGLSEEGKKTIEICDLNREDLVTARLKEREKVLIHLFNRYLEGKNPLFSEDMQYSMYLRLTLKATLEGMIAIADCSP